jgi:hypothetical protein
MLKPLDHAVLGGVIHDGNPARVGVEPDLVFQVQPVQHEQAVSHGKRRVVGKARLYSISIDIRALRIDRSESPEIVVVSRRIMGIGNVVLRHRLHRPANRMTSRVLHFCMKRNRRRIAADTDIARIPQTGYGIGGTLETHSARGPL